jgi:2-keto-4-pentenoate hydratase/2-oxohepta-3-ene-1,7-dioic acid hydratase in catechol pathway
LGFIQKTIDSTGDSVKLATYLYRGVPGWGVVTETGMAPMHTAWADLAAGLGAGVPALTLALSRVTCRLPLSELEWTAPVSPVSKILCVGINYGLHIQEMGREVPANPSVFVRFADSFVGHEQPVVRPFVSERLDYEAELAIVIGQPCRHVSVEQAMDYVGGYTCLADNSVRDFQKHAAQVTPGKNFERSGSIGPWIVTADEVPDPHALEVNGRLNGQLMQKGHTSDMLFSIAKMISYIGTFTQLRPGDVIATGTPEGVGAGRTPPVWMRPGDVYEIAISGVGTLRNPVVDEPSAHRQP